LFREFNCRSGAKTFWTTRFSKHIESHRRPLVGKDNAARVEKVNPPVPRGWLRQDERSFKGHHATLWEPAQFVTDNAPVQDLILDPFGGRVHGFGRRTKDGSLQRSAGS